jgi:hypothetical protein
MDIQSTLIIQDSSSVGNLIDQYGHGIMIVHSNIFPKKQAYIIKKEKLILFEKEFYESIRSCLSAGSILKMNPLHGNGIISGEDGWSLPFRERPKVYQDCCHCAAKI